ncbi:MAG: D-serine ammonia-lyase [Clostridia bacterium]|nr:D-serine ammonia-lyase [Clostridia bacterium]
MDSYENMIYNDVVKLKPVFWNNMNKQNSDVVLPQLSLKYDDIIDAEKRLNRFAPFIKKCFPETNDGIIESSLIEISGMKDSISKTYDKKIHGRVYAKCDNHLEVAGSIKARGGIYEVLKFAEKLAMDEGLLSGHDNYEIMKGEQFKELFSQHNIIVGSTGNLGLSIGIIGSALGFKVIVHMSSDAKEWKKKLLRNRGVKVIEHKGDFTRAVERARMDSEKEPNAYMIDDENSKELFLGYSVAALRIAQQLKDKGIIIDKDHHMNVYIPCGVGGAPGGITFGLKHIFGDNVSCFFVEPTNSPSMLLSLLTKQYNKFHIKNYGINNKTDADGLAVGSPSKFVAPIAEKLIDGIYTIEDKELYKLVALMKDTEDIKIELSAAAGLLGPTFISGTPYDIHVAWLTGGIFLPEETYNSFYDKGKQLIINQ